MTHQTAIGIFAYKRPAQLKKLLESLLRCQRVDECSVHIFCDGPKKPEVTPQTGEVLSIAREAAEPLKAEIHASKENLGLARSMSGGITALAEQYERFIVLEDDLIVHPYFIDFLLQGLDRYEDVEEVGQIAGFTFPVKTPPRPHAFFLPLTTTWGWASWRRAWDLFSLDLETARQMLEVDQDLRLRFDLDGAYKYSEILSLTAQGGIDTWDIQWYWQTFIHEKLTLYPRESLAWQNGIDENATHTHTLATSIQKPYPEFLRTQWPDKIIFPESVRTNDVVFRRLKIFLKQLNSQSKLKVILSGIGLKLKSLYTGNDE